MNRSVVTCSEFLAYLGVPPRSIQSIFVPDVESGVAALLERLYLNPLRLPIPQNSPKTDRNTEIRALYANGLSIPKLARQFGISNARVHQILTGAK